MPQTTFYGQDLINDVKTGDALDTIFDTSRFNYVKIVVAWIRRTGVQVISQRLREFLSYSPDNWVDVTFGCGFGGTSSEAVRDLLKIGEECDGQLRLRAYLQPRGTFHPKIYYAQQTDGDIAVAIGSSNLTGAALMGDNSESLLLLDSNDLNDDTPLHDIDDYIDYLNDEDSLEYVIRVQNEQSIEQLKKKKFLSSEKKLRKAAKRTKNRSNRGISRISSLRTILGLPSLSSSTIRTGSSSSPVSSGASSSLVSSGASSSPVSSGPSSSSSRGSRRAPSASTVASFSTASRIEMVLQNDGGRKGSPYVKIPVVASSFFPPTQPGPRKYDDCYISIEFIDKKGNPFVPRQDRRWWFRPTGEWSLETGNQARRLLEWADGGILVVTRLTAMAQQYRIEVIQPSDSTFSSRYAALDPDSAKNVTAFP